jgi:pilus assembly protein Flp/PilA
MNSLVILTEQQEVFVILAVSTISGNTTDDARRHRVVTGVNPMKNLVSRFAKDESGATAIEYGLIAALIAVVCITIWTQVGTRLIARFTSVSNALNR